MRWAGLIEQPLVWVSLLSLLVLGEAMHKTHGHYKVNRIIWVTLALIAFFVAHLAQRDTEDPARNAQKVRRGLHVLLCVWLAMTARNNALLFAKGWAVEAINGLLYLAFVLACLITGLRFSARRGAWAYRILWASIVLLALSLFAARPLVLIASPTPAIDVFNTAQLAADFLLSGKNPYTQVYPDIYAGRFDYTPGMVYWPGALLPETLARAVINDIRGAFLVAEGLIFLAMYKIANAAGHDRMTSAIAAIAWLAFPVSLFVLEQSWIDTLLLAAVLLFIWAFMSGKPAMMGLCLGAALAAKQYGLLAVLSAVPLLGRGWIKVTLFAGLSFSLIMLPFGLIDPAAFWRMTVEVPLGQAMRTDAFSLVPLIFKESGAKVPGAVSAGLYGLTLCGLVFELIRADRRSAHGALRAMVGVYTVVFLLGKQAFCNYYTFLAGLLLAAIISAPAKTLDADSASLIAKRGAEQPPDHPEPSE